MGPNSLQHQYETGQLDLACLDTMRDDFSEYGRCLAFAWRSSSVEAVSQMLEANGALAFDDHDPQTTAELWAWHAAQVAA